MAFTCPILLVIVCVYTTIKAQLPVNCQQFIRQNAFFEAAPPADTYCWTCRPRQNNQDPCPIYYNNKPNGKNLRFQFAQGASAMAAALLLVHKDSACPDGRPMHMCWVQYVCPNSGNVCTIHPCTHLYIVQIYTLSSTVP